jgi:hypothetical protein
LPHPRPAATQQEENQRHHYSTRFQAFVAASGVLLVAVPVALQQLDGNIPPHLYAVLATAALAITTIAGVVTRVMALPAVAQFIGTYLPWLAAGTPGQDG